MRIAYSPRGLLCVLRIHPEGFYAYCLFHIPYHVWRIHHKARLRMAYCVLRIHHKARLRIAYSIFRMTYCAPLRFWRDGVRYFVWRIVYCV